MYANISTYFFSFVTNNYYYRSHSTIRVPVSSRDSINRQMKFTSRKCSSPVSSIIKFPFPTRKTLEPNIRIYWRTDSILTTRCWTNLQFSGKSLDEMSNLEWRLIFKIGDIALVIVFGEKSFPSFGRIQRVKDRFGIVRAEENGKRGKSVNE